MSSLPTKVDAKAAAQLFQSANDLYCQAVMEALLGITPENFSVDLHVTIRVGAGGKPSVQVKAQPLFKGVGSEGSSYKKT
jgi:hypothetical protein